MNIHEINTTTAAFIKTPDNCELISPYRENFYFEMHSSLLGHFCGGPEGPPYCSLKKTKQNKEKWVEDRDHRSVSHCQGAD